jgi:hypothetical protein
MSVIRFWLSFLSTGASDNNMEMDQNTSLTVHRNSFMTFSPDDYMSVMTCFKGVWAIGLFFTGFDATFLLLSYGLESENMWIMLLS